MFARWGRFVYRFRWATLVVSAVLLGASVIGVLTGGQVVGNEGFGASLEAGRTASLVTRDIHRDQPVVVTSGMTLIFSSATLKVTEAEFQAAMESAIAPLRGDARISGLTTPYSVPASEQATFMSRDGHKALVMVQFKDQARTSERYINEVIAAVHPGPLTVVATGQVPLNLAFNSTLDSDLVRAEYVALPVTFLMLILIFAAIVAALLPLGVGLLAIVGGLAGTMLLARFTDVSQYATNIVSLIGLAVAIDYSLFVVNRFRDELAAGATREEAIAIAMSTAGRAITFSGVTVAIGLSAMLFYQGTFMASMGAAGGIVVAIAVIYGLTFLPAALAILGNAVDWWPRWARRLVPSLGVRRPAETGAWHAMATWVMRRPWFALIPALAVLIALGTPFLQLRMASSDVDALPPSNQARQGYDTLINDFPGWNESSVEAVAYYPDSSPFSPEHIGATYDLGRRLAALPNVIRVESIFDINPGLGRLDYQSLYSGSRDSLPSAMQDALANSAGKHIVLLNVLTNTPYTSDESRAIVRAVRAEHLTDGQVLATGGTAFDLDVVNFILQRTPVAIGTVILVTYVILFLLTGSVVLPLKAVLTNLFSISASFGALVFVFQQGHLSGLLGFTAQSIDPSIPVILFSLVFGMSMDYEVLLISRIQEEYQRTGDNQAGVAMGLEKSGRLITGAAAIMCAVFIAFGLAQVVIIKSIGIGLAVAIALDATTVRILIVPAVMRILGRANWWAPRPLALLHRRLGAGEFGAQARQPVREGV